MKAVRTFFIIALIGFVVLLAGTPAAVAEPVKLKAVTFQGKQVTFVDAFFIFKDILEKEAKDVVSVDYLGGPEAIPPFEQIESVKNGVVDMALLPAAYYVPQMPVADAVKLSELTPWEERKSGAYDFLNKQHQKQVNCYYLGRFTNGIKFHLYLNKMIEKPDLSGLKIRVTPVYKPFVEKLGGIAITTAPGEVYTALERGVVDGYGWPSIKISDFGWHEVTKYIVDPGFYQVDVGIVVNLDKWNKLSDKAKNALIEAAKKAEHASSEHYAKVIKEEREFILDKGVKPLTFSPEDSKKYIDLAYEAAWNEVYKRAPELGKEYKKLITKQPE